MRPQAEEVSIFHLDVNQNDEDRFYDVTSEAIGTKDLLHFDVYRDEKVNLAIHFMPNYCVKFWFTTT